MSLTDWNALHGNTFDGLRVLVTGGAGFIGSHLCEALTALGAATWWRTTIFRVPAAAGTISTGSSPARNFKRRFWMSMR